MQQTEGFLKCWEYFLCNKKECPVYDSNELRCWLQCGTYCHDGIQESWLEKMEICIRCDIFKRNFQAGDLTETFTLVSAQFEDYKKRMLENVRQLEETKRNLVNFKSTSVYLLRELDKKSKELFEAKKDLERKVEERTRELRSTQEQLIQSAKLSSLGQFAAGIAHEINNPLAGMFNCIRTLLQNRDIKGREKEYLCLVEKGLSRIENTVRQIFVFSGSQLGKFQEVDVNLLIGDSLDFMGHKIKEQMITLEKSFSSSPLIISGDRSQLQQVFMNTISNSVDAIYENGYIGIESRKIIEDNKEWVRVQFSDNGCGIDEKDINRIFDPFYTTKEVGEGLGLGLSISHRMIQNHGGRIRIKSKKGAGTTVEILLPVHRQSADEKYQAGF